MTYPEIFDLVVLQTRLSQPSLPLPAPPASPPITTALKKRIAKRLKDFQPNSAHRDVVKFCADRAMPLLTTNFDHALEKVLGCTHFASRRVTTPYYRWETYHAPARLTLPLEEFGIWHLHGSIRVPSSLRLGLNDYAGAIQRVRSDLTPFFSWVANGKHGEPPGYAKNLMNTWVEIFLTRHPIIVSLNLAPHEMLLRWLLIRGQQRLYPLRRSPARHLDPLGRDEQGLVAGNGVRGRGRARRSRKRVGIRFPPGQAAALRPRPTRHEAFRHLVVRELEFSTRTFLEGTWRLIAPTDSFAMVSLSTDRA